MKNEDTAAVYQRAGFGHRLGFGQNPAVIVVDMQLGFTDPKLSSAAADFSLEISHITRLIAAARDRSTPVLFVTTAFESPGQAEASRWVEKIPALHRYLRGSELVELDPRLPREADDLLVTKQNASAFFGTSLASTLNAWGIDTLIVTGGTTSGCIRATVIDGISHGFRPVVPREAVGDRSTEPHEANLFDMDSKYGDVRAIGEVISYLNGIADRRGSNHR